MKFSSVRRFALSLPEVTEEPHHHFGSYRVRGRIFLTVPPEQQHIHVFVPEERREMALTMHPEFTEKLLWGGKVVGVRVAVAAAPAATVKTLVRAAWEYKAHKSTRPPRSARAP